MHSLKKNFLYANNYLSIRSYHKAIKVANNADHVVNLRSDTFTMPCINMREAMNSAVLGDDVWQEDETVLALEKRMAELAGKEEGLFVASGTMGNLLSILSHCSRRGAEVLLGDMSHIFHTEQANIVQFGGVQPHVLPTRHDGTFTVESLRDGLRSNDFHYPSSELICIENTHGQLGGRVLPVEWIDEVTQFAELKGIPIHVDGARIFNASVACGLPLSRLLRGISSASICLSKGLGAPIGSVVVGNSSFVNRARRLRKGIGGGWRQAGVVAAGGLYALENNIERLSYDHRTAAIIAQGINDLNSHVLHVDMSSVQTNMILVQVNTTYISVEDFCRKLSEVSDEEKDALGCTVSVQACPYTAMSFRLVTHLNITESDAERALSKVRLVVEKIREEEL